jgi:hypothetical protein
VDAGWVQPPVYRPPGSRRLRVRTVVGALLVLVGLTTGVIGTLVLLRR